MPGSVNCMTAATRVIGAPYWSTNRTPVSLLLMNRITIASGA